MFNFEESLYQQFSNGSNLNISIFQINIEEFFQEKTWGLFFNEIFYLGTPIIYFV